MQHSPVSTLRSFKAQRLAGAALIEAQRNLVQVPIDCGWKSASSPGTAVRARALLSLNRQMKRTQWEHVIDVFNNRFFVPFKLEVQNWESVSQLLDRR